MAKIAWDEDGKRLYETGVDHGVLYLLESDNQGNVSYGDAIPWNGLTGVTESPDGADANDIYADNMKYLSLISKENWKGTIKAYTYPLDFNKCMGQEVIPNKKSFFGQQARTKFGFSWRSLVGNDVVGDQYGYKLHIAYGLSAAPTEMDHATTNDSPEAQEFSWEISSIPASTTTKIHADGTTTTGTMVELAAVAHITILSTCSVIEDIEAKLYGTDDSEVGADDGTTGTLPTLGELITFLNTGSWS